MRSVNSFSVMNPRFYKKATSAVEQTLSCKVGDVLDAVYFTWMDTDDNEIGDLTEGYTINQGTVNGNNQQTSTLTISAARLGALDTSSPLTWKCAAQSLQFPESAKSADSEVVVTFLVLGKTRLDSS